MSWGTVIMLVQSLPMIRRHGRRVCIHLRRVPRPLELVALRAGLYLDAVLYRLLVAHVADVVARPLAYAPAHIAGLGSRLDTIRAARRQINPDPAGPNARSPNVAGVGK